MAENMPPGGSPNVEKIYQKKVDASSCAPMPEFSHARHTKTSATPNLFWMIVATYQIT
jgi:hypothetical protein